MEFDLHIHLGAQPARPSAHYRTNEMTSDDLYERSIGEDLFGSPGTFVGPPRIGLLAASCALESDGS